MDSQVLLYGGLWHMTRCKNHIFLFNPYGLDLGKGLTTGKFHTSLLLYQVRKLMIQICGFLYL